MWISNLTLRVRRSGVAMGRERRKRKRHSRTCRRTRKQRTAPGPGRVALRVPLRVIAPLLLQIEGLPPLWSGTLWQVLRDIVEHVQSRLGFGQSNRFIRLVSVQPLEEELVQPVGRIQWNPVAGIINLLKREFCRGPSYTPPQLPSSLTCP